MLTWMATLDELTGNDSTEAERIAQEAVKRVQDRFRVLRVVGYAVVIDTGRNFYDGTPITARLWVPPKSPKTVVVGDGGQTLARIGENGCAPAYAMSVRRELLDELPVQDMMGQVAVMAPANKAAEALSVLADSCIALDVAVIVAKHHRPKG